MPKLKKTSKKRKKTSNIGIWILIGCLLIVIAGFYAKNMSIATHRQQLLATVPPQHWDILADLYFANLHFTITDVDTGEPVSDAHITVTIQYIIDMTDEAYTDANGHALIETFQSTNTRIECEHPNYETRSDTIDTTSSQAVVDVYIDWTLIPASSPPPNLVKVTLYAQVDLQDWLIVGDVSFDSESYAFMRDRNHVHKVVMWLQQNRLYTMFVNGAYSDWLDPSRALRLSENKTKKLITDKSKD